MQYKKYDFTLEEIEVLSYYEGASNLKDKDVIKKIIQILNQKIHQIEANMEEMENVLSYLHREVEEYKKT